MTKIFDKREYTGSRVKTKMSVEFHDPDWHIGCKVVLHEPRGLNVLGKLPGILKARFGEDAHPVLLPFTRHSHDATVFYDSTEPDREKAALQAAAVILGVTEQLEEKPDAILLHIGLFALCRDLPNSPELFEDMPDSGLFVPPQRIAC